jgi:hypothetical protein
VTDKEYSRTFPEIADILSNTHTFLIRLGS